MRRALAIIALCLPGLLLSGRAHATTGFFFCAEVVDGDCTTWTSVIDGVLSLDELGITPTALAELMGFGFGVVILPFIIGLVAGSMKKGVKSALED